MTTKINMLAIDLAKGSFQVCAVGPEGTVLYNRGLSRTRLADEQIAGAKEHRSGFLPQHELA